MQFTSCRLIISGRSLEKAEAYASELNHQFSARRAFAASVDVTNEDDLHRAFEGADLVVLSAPYGPYMERLVTIALETSTDCLDIQLSKTKLDYLRSMAHSIRESRRCFITEAGFHPGLPSALVRFAAQELEGIQRAVVASAIDVRPHGPMPASMVEIVESIKEFRHVEFVRGRWIERPTSWFLEPTQMDFGDEAGTRSCTPMYLHEMENLPELLPTLRETGFYMAGFNWFTDLFVTPMVSAAMRISPERSRRPMAKFLYWGLKNFSTRPQGTYLQLSTSGRKGDRLLNLDVRLHHEDEYMFTAIPTVACILQYLQGSIRKSGLWMMGHVVDPSRLIADMQEMGVNLSVKVHS